LPQASRQRQGSLARRQLEDCWRCAYIAFSTRDRDEVTITQSTAGQKSGAAPNGSSALAIANRVPSSRDTASLTVNIPVFSIGIPF
jgi:hypothetical protein